MHQVECRKYKPAYNNNEQCILTVLSGMPGGGMPGGPGGFPGAAPPPGGAGHDEGPTVEEVD